MRRRRVRRNAWMLRFCRIARHGARYLVSRTLSDLLEVEHYWHAVALTPRRT